MSDWTDGYVTGIGYTYGVYRELAPAMLSFVGLVAGIATPDPSAALNYCELGCGQGYGANLVAAANPHIQVYANDFNPAHIAGARALAAAAETANVHFYDDNFAEFGARSDLPEFDMIVLHGTYSWISAENRSHIVDFLRTRLKVGGLAYISYNTLPGLASVMPLRRLMADHVAAQPGSMEQRVNKARAYIQGLLDTDPAYPRLHPGVAELFESLKRQSASYIAHEYLNRDWTAFYFADVVAELAEAKLSYVGSADFFGNADAANLTPEQQALLNNAASRTERETLRDYMLNQRFRRDVFVKGALKLETHETQAQWLKTRFILTSNRPDVPLTVKGILGETPLQEDVYKPLLDGLADGARTTRQLLENPEVVALGWFRLQQALMILVGSGHLQPALDAAGDDERAASARTFNLALMNKARSSDELRFYAAPKFGGAVKLSHITQLFLFARHLQRTDAPEFVWEILQHCDEKVLKNGEALQTSEENLAELHSLLAIFDIKQIPVLRSVGII